MPPPPARRLLLIFGSFIAALNLVVWTAADYSTYGVITSRGLVMALFVQTAVLLLYVILRLALILTGEDAA
jgi:hypothetical protein